MDSAPDFESGGWGFESLRDRLLLLELCGTPGLGRLGLGRQLSAIGLVVKYLVANEVPRVRFPDGAFAFVAQLAARGSHNPKVAGSTPVESIFANPRLSSGGRQKWCFRWDSNPRPQDGLELESSALDHSATKATALN